MRSILRGLSSFVLMDLITTWQQVMKATGQKIILWYEYIKVVNFKLIHFIMKKGGSDMDIQ